MSIKVIEHSPLGIKTFSCIYENNQEITNYEVLKYSVLSFSHMQHIERFLNHILFYSIKKDLLGVFGNAGFQVFSGQISQYFSKNEITTELGCLIADDISVHELVGKLSEFARENWDDEFLSKFLGEYYFHDRRNLMKNGGYNGNISSWSELEAIPNKSQYIKFDHVFNDRINSLFRACGKIFIPNIYKDMASYYGPTLCFVDYNKFSSFIYNGRLALNKVAYNFDCSLDGFKYSCTLDDNENVIMCPVLDKIDSGKLRTLKNVCQKYSVKSGNKITIHIKLSDIINEIGEVKVCLNDTGPIRFIRSNPVAKAELKALSKLKIRYEFMDIKTYTNDELKNICRMLDVRVTGDKNFLINEIVAGLCNLYQKIYQDIYDIFPKLGVLSKVSPSEDYTRLMLVPYDKMVKIESSEKSIILLHNLYDICINTFAIKHSRFDSLFNKDSENDIFDTKEIISALLHRKIETFKTFIELEESL